MFRGYDHLFEATVDNGDCVSVGDACICYDWNLACVAEDAVISSDKVIAPTREADGDWEDIEIYLNVFENRESCSGFRTIIPVQLKYNECKF